MRWPLSPYFASLARTGRACPRCGRGPTSWEGQRFTWDVAVERCRACGWLQAREAPEGAGLGPREPAPPGGRIIKVDFGNATE